MVDVAVYVEFKAKALIKELSENFDIRKCGDLYQTLGDLLKLTDAPLQDQDADVISTLSENAKEPPPMTRTIFLCRLIEINRVIALAQTICGFG